MFIVVSLTYSQKNGPQSLLAFQILAIITSKFLNIYTMQLLIATTSLVLIDLLAYTSKIQ